MDRAADLVDRVSVSGRSVRLWVADFTLVLTWAGFVDVASVVDVLAQRVVAWNAVTIMATALVMTPVPMAS